MTIFANDNSSSPVLNRLAKLGIRYVLVRAADHDHVNLPAAHALGFRVTTVPHYSSFVIAEHALALMLALPNVLINGHQGFFTREALTNLATTIALLDGWLAGQLVAKEL